MRTFFFKFSFFVIAIILSYSCRKSTYNVYSPDRKQCVTIITEESIRYIINGSYKYIPDTNFVKIDLSNIDREVGDEVVGCWKKEGYDWIIMNDKAIILENKLDSTHYKFIERFPVDVDNIPTLKEYTSNNCFDLGFLYFKIVNKRNTIVERVK